jgi:putative solute:sodium symporter small subunit
VVHLKKIDKKVADAYFREKNRYMFVYFALWFLVSYVMVALADSLTEIQFLGFPFHYFMGAIGALFTFIVLLFVNAFVGDKIDEKYGIDHARNEEIGAKNMIDH